MPNLNLSQQQPGTPAPNQQPYAGAQVNPVQPQSQSSMHAQMPGQYPAVEDVYTETDVITTDADSEADFLQSFQQDAQTMGYDDFDDSAYLYEDDDDERQLFGNKKMNIVLGIIGAVVLIGVIAAAVWAFVL